MSLRGCPRLTTSQPPHTVSTIGGFDFVMLHVTRVLLLLLNFCIVQGLLTFARRLQVTVAFAHPRHIHEHVDSFMHASSSDLLSFINSVPDVQQCTRVLYLSENWICCT